MKPKLYLDVLHFKAILLWHLRFIAIQFWYRLTTPYYKWRSSIAKPIEPNVRTGQRFSIAANFSTSGLTSWRAPFTGGFNCEIPEGTLLEVISDSVPTAIGFACRPVNYIEFEHLHVPEADRMADKYGGYYFIFKKSDIGGLLIAAS